MMALMLANSLVSRSGGLGPGYDPSAQSYITAVETAKGSSMTTGQKDAINSFVLAEKAASRWADLRRLFFPVWANAAANAICMKGLSSGTFINSPTQGAGFVQGNGTTQCFRDNATPDALGLTLTSGALFSLVYQADSRTDARYFIGCRAAAAAGECALYQITATQVNSLIGRVPSVPVGAVTPVNRAGIYHANRNGSGITASRRGSGGVTRGGTDAGTSPVTALININYMALNDNGSDSNHTDARLGAYGVSLGIATNASVDDFTLNLKTLWETATGLTLP